MNVGREIAARDLRLIFGQWPAFSAPCVNAAIQECRVVTVAQVIQRVIRSACHWVPGGGIDHNLRIVSYTEPFESILELFSRRKFGIVALNKVAQGQKSSARDMAVVVV